jgi:transposase
MRLMQCPLCKQLLPADEIPYAHRREVARERRKVARILRAQGMSMRQIQRACGWKSVHSVELALEAKNNKGTT